MKECSKCREVKEVEAFSKDKTRKDGIDNWCNLCRKTYRTANRERRKERAKIYNAENREKRAAYNKIYRTKTPEKQRANRRRWYVKNPEKVREKTKKRVGGLSDGYINGILKQSGFTPTQIAENPELIELKRVIIKTKRFIKTKEDEKH